MIQFQVQDGAFSEHQKDQQHPAYMLQGRMQSLHHFQGSSRHSQVWAVVSATSYGSKNSIALSLNNAVV